MGNETTRRWYHWYSPDDTPEERRLIRKLDLLIVPYAFVIYWVKYIDQKNINNAYVSGMSEDLGFHGNQLVELQIIFTVGNVLGLLPFAHLFPKVPMHWLVPALDLGWGMFTLIQYRANSLAELMAYRFMVSIFEASYFPGVHFVLGSWYKSDEIGRRGGVFYTGLTLGTLTAGLLQSAASSRLDGHLGLAGWRWMFILGAIITLPLAVLGLFIWPGTPDKPNRLLLSEDEIKLVRSRFERYGAKLEALPSSWKSLIKIFTGWKFYILVIWDIFFFNSGANTAAFLLWIKNLHRFDVSHINQLGTIAPALEIFYVLFITLMQIIPWSTWSYHSCMPVESYGTYHSLVLYGWANIILRHSVEERALTLILMTAIATSTNTWIPLLVYPTVESPKFPKGYPYSAAMVVCLILMTQVVRIIYNMEEARYATEARGESSNNDEEAETQRISYKPSTDLKGLINVNIHQGNQIF